MNRKFLLLDTHEKPSTGKWIILSLQHVFAMFGATVLVPLLTGLDVGVALVSSGIGTLIYILCTKGKVPVYLGSSFAFIGAIVAASAVGGYASSYLGIMIVGLIYIAVGVIIAFVGSDWLKKLLPPVVIGPMIIIIGLSLAPTSISSSGLDGSAGYTHRELSKSTLNTNDFYNSTDGDVIYFLELDQSSNTYELIKFSIINGNEYTANETVNSIENDQTILVYSSNPRDTDLSVNTVLYSYSGGTFNSVKSNGSWLAPLVALITLLTVIVMSLFAKGFLKVIPFIIAVGVGYLASAAFGLIDWSLFSGAKLLQIPNFSFLGTYKLDWSAVLLFAPIAFVTIAEHIGDHTVLSEVCEKDFITDPGLHRTLLGDGIATFVGGALGGPANTTYGENTGVVALTKVGSVWVTGLAAIFAIFLGFIGYVQAFIMSIPWAVIGGMTIVLYGLIAGNGVKVLIKDRTDLGNMKNLIIVSVMLVIGLGGAVLKIGTLNLTGMSLAAIVGIILNLILPNKLEETK